MNKLILFMSLFSTGLLYSQELGEVLNENFNDNSHNWDIDNESGYSSTIQNGQYIINNSSNESLIWTNSIEYNLEESFSIECQIKYTNTKGAFMFLTNFNDWESPYLGFVVTEGLAKPIYFNGNTYANGGVYAEKIEDASFKKKDNLINFKVECVLVDDGPYNHQEMTFYINDVKIGVDENVNAHSSLNKIGFLLDPNAEVEIDYIKISGTPIIQELPNIMEISSSKLGSSASGITNVVTIQAGQPIYAKIFLKESFYDYMGGAGYNIKVDEIVYINNERASLFDWTMNSTAIKNQGNNYSVDMAPEVNDIPSARESYTLTKNLVDLEPGIHDIKIVVAYQKVGLSTSNTLGEVNFKFDNTSVSGRNKFKEMVSAYRSQALKDVTLPEAKMKNTTVEASVKQAIIDAGWIQTPIKVIIMESDWHTVTDKFYGNILQRQINVAVVVKNDDNFCTIFYPSVYQEYQGNGKYSSVTTLGGMHKIEQDIDCSNVN